MSNNMVQQQLEAVRRSGKANMFDRSLVQRVAYESDYFELVNWIEDHSSDEYVQLLMDNDKGGLYGEELDVDPVLDVITFETSL